MSDLCACKPAPNGDIPCHTCGQMVNVKCWNCGTVRGEGPCPMYGRWVLWNERDDRPASLESFPSRELAERTLQGYRDRDARGGRPDLHDVMPHVVVRRA